MAPVNLIRRQPTDGFAINEDSDHSRHPTIANKRLRLSNNNQQNDETESIATDLDRYAQIASTQTQRFNREEYERLRDATVAPGTEEEEREEEIDRFELEKLEQERATTVSMQGINKEKTNGVLESVDMVNFMCHSRVHVALGPLINFIVGHNGSGKSATLTAIQLCLGGKAASTNRGGSLKSFVKHGQENASVIVKIRNKGAGNYKHDLYGDSIIVERHFNIHGASGYKLKSASGRIISTKKLDLDDLNDFYGFSMDNPLNVLTQDAARQFLNSSSPNEKYKFFVQGVQLETLDQDYKLVVESLDAISPKLEDGKKVLEGKRKAYQDAESRVNIYKRSAKTRELYKTVAKQYAWSQVADEERKLQEIQRNIDRAHEQARLKQSEADEADKVYTEADEAAEARRQALDLHERSIDPVSEAKQTAEQQKSAKAIEFADSRILERTVRETMKTSQGNIRRLENLISEEYARLEAANGGSEAEKIAEIEEAEEALADAQRRRVAASDETEAIEKDFMDSKGAETRFREQLKTAGDAVEEAKRQLQIRQRNDNNIDGAYPRSLPNVRRAIENEHGWRTRPVGPLGQHMRLLKPEWAGAVEKLFGNNMFAFATDNREDANKLRAIFSRNNYSGPIVNVPNRKITLHEPDASFDTLLRILQIDNDMVRNAAIINQHAEKTIFVQNRSELSNLLYSTRPENVLNGVCQNGPGFFLRFSYGMNNMPKSDPIDGHRGPLRIRTSREDEIRIAQENIDAAVAERQNVQAQLRTAQETAVAKQNRRSQHKRVLEELKREANDVDDRIRQLKDELAEAAPQDGLLDSLKTQVDEEREKLSTYQAQLENQRRISEERKREEDEAEVHLSDLVRQIEKHEGQKRRIQERIKTLMTGRQEALRKKNTAISEAERARKVEEDLDAEREDQARITAQMEGSAREFCPERVEVPPNETTDSLQQRLNKLNSEITRARERIGGDGEQLYAQLRQAKEGLRAYGSHVSELELCQQQMSRTLADRHERWRLFRSHITARAKGTFYFLLSQRNFTGRIHMDHSKRQLNLTIAPSNDTGSRRKTSDERQTKTLSGGEKSFSTICLLLSMWEAMGSPIRCLDEFDVFMDSVNREITMRIMIETARASVGRQYILISPQGMGKINYGPDVKVCRMTDPERGQTTLDFGANDSGA